MASIDEPPAEVEPVGGQPGPSLVAAVVHIKHWQFPHRRSHIGRALLGCGATVDVAQLGHLTISPAVRQTQALSNQVPIALFSRGLARRGALRLLP